MYSFIVGTLEARPFTFEELYILDILCYTIADSAIKGKHFSVAARKPKTRYSKEEDLCCHFLNAILP